MRNLRRQKQTLINDGPRRERRDVKKGPFLQVGLGDLILGALADDVELSFQRVLVHAVGATNENLLDIRLGAARQAPDGVAVDGCVAPAEDGQPLVPDDFFQDALAGHALVLFHRQEHYPHAVFAGRR